MAYFQRVIVLIDMDCFFCQVEEKLNPEIAGKPVAVVQYNAWQSGGLIAVNYPARNRGVTRHMIGSEAKKVCPELIIVSAPITRGKSDITRYKDAGKSVADVFFSFTTTVERASVDEAYLDITELVEDRLQSNYEIERNCFQNTHVVNFEIDEFINSLDYNLNEQDYKLALGAIITEEIRSAVYNITGYHCSAGIAHNKILAKLAAGMHKPNQQTILPHSSVAHLYDTLKINKIRGLGGKFGMHVAETLSINFMKDLYKFSEKELQQKFDVKMGSFLYQIARGINNEPVIIREKAKSVGCSKNFSGKSALTNKSDLVEWVNDLSFLLSERLNKDFEEYKRKAKNLIVIFTYQNSKENVTNSRTHPLNSYEPTKISEYILEVLNKHCIKDSTKFKIKHIGLSATKFEDCSNSKNLKDFFQNSVAKRTDQRVKEEATQRSTAINEELMTSIRNEKRLNETENDELIYSASTLSLDESQDVPYVGEDLECNDENCNFGMKISQDFSAENFTTNETIIENKRNPLEESSFFNNYFKENEQDSTNRNASSHLEDMEVCEDISNHNETCITDTNTSSVLNMELCDECNKSVPISDIMSHKDHHFALKLYKEQTVIQRTPSQKANKVEIKSRNKRKFKNVENCATLTAFLKSADVPEDEPTETCPECTKRIPSKDIMSHTDYHAAKRLHLEINNTSKENINTNKSNTINSYFKPL